MIRVTINFKEDVYANIINKKEDKTISKYVNETLKELFDSGKDNTVFDEISKHLSSLNNNLSYLVKKQKLHFTLSLQHFVNQCYSDNLDPKNDKCWKKIENNFYDKFNS